MNVFELLWIKSRQFVSAEFKIKWNKAGFRDAHERANLKSDG